MERSHQRHPGAIVASALQLLAMSEFPATRHSIVAAIRSQHSEVRRSAFETLATTYWKDLYPRNPPGYRTQLCHDGGPLDLNPESDRWP